MNCDTAQGALSAAFDGELETDDDAVAQAHAHAGDCAACRRFVEHLDAGRAYLRAAPTDVAAAPPVDLAATVLAEVRRADNDDHEAAAVATAGGGADGSGPIEHRRRHRRRGRSNRATTRGARRSPPPRHADRRARRLSAAAVFVAAALAAALLVHSSTDGPDVAAADLAERVVAAQHDVSALSARVTIVERGWNPAVPERRFEGALRYRAPESLALWLRDQTTYPDGSWPANDLDFTVDQDTWAVAGLRDCPSRAQPGCNPPRPDHRLVTGREPFSPAAPAPLDLIMPVQSFALAGSIVTQPDAVVGGRPTIGIEATAAQVGPLLSGVRPTGNLRQVHPADPVELRLDRDTLVPLQVTVSAGAGGDRRAWADARGYADRPGTPIIELTLTDLEVNDTAVEPSGDQPTDDQPADDRPGGGGVTFDPPPAPPGSDGAATTDGAFRDQDVGGADAPGPKRLPMGLRPYRSGVTDTAEGPAVSTRTWTDGRAWLAVSATAEWPGGRLFGDLGGIVRTIDLGAGGVGYLSEDGERIGLHTDRLDLVVAGSVSRAELIDAAASLGVVGQPVPAGWDEAGTADVTTARRAITPLLLPTALDGFARPALRIEGDGDSGGGGVIASFAGPGDRSFSLEQSVAPKLPPPASADGVVAVTVRGGPGRYAVDWGELEWYGPEGNLYRLRSLTLSRDELLAIADGLAPA